MKRKLCYLIAGVLLTFKAFALNCPESYLEFPFSRAVITVNDAGVQCYYRDNENKKDIMYYIGEDDPFGVAYLPDTGPWEVRFRAWECVHPQAAICQFKRLPE